MFETHTAQNTLAISLSPRLFENTDGTLWFDLTKRVSLLCLFQNTYGTSHI